MLFTTQSPIFSHVIIPLVKAVIVLILGWLAARALCFVLQLLQRRSKLDKTTSLFLANLFYYLLLLIVVIIAINQFTSSASPLAATLGAGILAIGLALKSDLANLAAGILLIIARPYGLGDYVELEGYLGKVIVIHIFFTKIISLNNHEISIPNAKITAKAIVNLSRQMVKKLSYQIVFANDLDFGHLKSKLLAMIVTNNMILKHPQAEIFVDSANSKTYTVIVVIWVAPENAIFNQVNFIEGMIEGDFNYIDIKQQF